MTGLNLESFLHLLRADLGAWVTLAAIAVVLALMAWTSWGSRRALRKCLVLSVVAHCGLALYGGTVPGLMVAMHPEDQPERHDRIRQIKVVTGPDDAGPASPGGAPGGSVLSRWDRPPGGLALADAKLVGAKTAAAPDVAVRPTDRDELKTAAVAPPESPPPALSDPESRPNAPAEPNATPPAPGVTVGGLNDVAPAVVSPREKPASSPIASGLSNTRLRPDRDRPEPETAPARPRRPSALTALPDSPTSAAEPGPSAALAPPESLAPRLEASNDHDPAPTSAAEPGLRDVPPAAVIAAGPAAPRVGASAADLRARSRPGTTTVAPSSPAPRSPLAMDLNRAPVLESPALAPAGRPRGPEVAGEPSGQPAGDRPRPSAAGDDVAAAEVVKGPVAAAPAVAPPESDVRRRSRPSTADVLAPALTFDRVRPAVSAPLALVRVTPSSVPALPEIRGAAVGRPLADVPEVYRSRLDPNRSARAYRSGASPTSEQAVERALDWLARHQDDDGRWDGATARYDDGTPVKGDDDFTVRCPPGETCFGECSYWEADTALTGLALLSYLGAGYTQTDGKYAETVSKGLNFLLINQKPDGDLRGKSRAVGMYCHAMATIALCEAYAMTGDDRLRAPVERAVDFIVRSRARDGLAWRYAPGAPVGDTSILGWVVMALKSAREVGIDVPSGTQAGTLTWLSKIASGDSKGLARYQPWDNVTPTMTAEAWVCRQFLGVGGPGASSTESARYLLSHGPRTDTYNLYYWYYGTLAMYQHGGDAWYRWNAEVRDELTRRQVVRGHPAGSWAPDDSPYGAKGGRIYCTALATLTLEVYYRYLRLYDEPQIPPAVAPRPRGGDRDPALGRLVSPDAPAGDNGPKR